VTPAASCRTRGLRINQEPLGLSSSCWFVRNSSWRKECVVFPGQGTMDPCALEVPSLRRQLTSHLSARDSDGVISVSQVSSASSSFQLAPSRICGSPSGRARFVTSMRVPGGTYSSALVRNFRQTVFQSVSHRYLSTLPARRELQCENPGTSR
jgi:hypothetical protein